MYGHLVAVEVRVVGGADERMQTDGLAFHQQGLKGLDAQTVQGRGAVEQDGILPHHFGENVPDHQLFALHHLLGALDGGGMPAFLQLRVDEGLEELQRHLLGQAALMQLEVGAYGDDRTAGVVHALAQQVLAEAALLALDHVGEGLEGPAVGPGDGAAAAAVVEQGVHGFLQHALFVADDDLRRAQLHEPLEAVVAVDDATVEVVQVGGGEAAAVQRDEGAQLRRDDRDDFHDHPFGLVAGFEEGLDDLQPLGDLLFLGLALGGLAFLAQLDPQFLEVQLFQQRAHGLGAHAHGEHVVGAVVIQDLEVLVLGDDLLLLQIGLAGIKHDVGVEVEHLFQIGHGHVQQGADLGGQGLQEPDVGHGRGKLDVAHALAAHLGSDDFHAALFADDAAMLHALVLAAVAFVVLHGAEDLGAEQAVPLRLEGTVIDGLRFLHFAVGPCADGFGRSDGNLDGFQVADVGHVG